MVLLRSTFASELTSEIYFSCQVAQSAPIQNERIIAFMKIKVIVHVAEEGGFWAEVPGMPGCATQGETFEELLQNLHEAIEGCLSVE